MGDGGQMEHRVHLDAAVVAEKLAIRSLGLDVAGAVQVPLEHVLRVGRDHQVAGDALHDRHVLAAQRGEQVDLVGRNPHRGRHVVHRMRADDEGDRHVLAVGDVLLVDRLEVAGRDQIYAGLAPSAYHQAADADIGQPRTRIERDVHRG